MAGAARALEPALLEELRSASIYGLRATGPRPTCSTSRPNRDGRSPPRQRNPTGRLLALPQFLLGKVPDGVTAAEVAAWTGADRPFPASARAAPRDQAMPEARMRLLSYLRPNVQLSMILHSAAKKKIRAPPKSWRDRPAPVIAGLGLISGVVSASVGFELRIEALDWPGPCFSVRGDDADRLMLRRGDGICDRGPHGPRLGRSSRSLARSMERSHPDRALDAQGRRRRSQSRRTAAGRGVRRSCRRRPHTPVRGPVRPQLACLERGRTHVPGGRRRRPAVLFRQPEHHRPRILFLVWQPAVAYCIGLGLAGARQAQ